MANGNRNRNSSGVTVVKATLAALLLLIMAATLAVNFGGRANATGGGQGGAATTPPATEQPSAPPEASEAPETPAAETPAPETPSPEPAPTPGGGSSVADGTAADVGANLAVIVPEGEPVGDEYFDDAVFVGDSRTEGLRMYSGLTNARFFSGVGLSVDRVFTDQIVNLNGQYLTVADALRAADYGKVYIMLGMNELGWVYESVYADYYAQIIDIIRETHPDAVIYVQSILPVSQWKDGSVRDVRGEGRLLPQRGRGRAGRERLPARRRHARRYAPDGRVLQDMDGIPEDPHRLTHGGMYV